MEDDLLLGSVGVELAAEAVEVGIDSRGAEAACALEDRMLHEVSRSLRELAFGSGSAFDAEGAVAYLAGAAFDGVLQAALTSSASHLCSRVPCVWI